MSVAPRLKLPLLLAALVVAAVAIHRFNPVHWPPLAVDILHSLHGPGFAALSLIVYWFLQRRFPASSNYLVAAGITLGIGVISEAAQIPGPRDAQFSDLVVDGLGIFGALGVLAAFDAEVRATVRPAVRRILPLSAGFAVAIACGPTLWLSYAMLQQYRAFPELVTFEHAWERSTFGQTADARPAVVGAPDSWPVEGDKVARALENGRWGIFISLHPRPDWRAYESVSFVAASAGEPFTLDVGLKDMKKAGEDHGVAFYKSIRVTPEPRRITIGFDEVRAAAKSRPFDFALVEAIVLSAADPGGGAAILVDDFRLEP